jgi:tetratricopeptide (TPR) repeat protein
MKRVVYFIFLFYYLSSFLVIHAQDKDNNPNSPNFTDKNRLKQGRWTHFYTKSWNPTLYPKEAFFYRIVTYKDDYPIGKVRDYYKNGALQMEADSMYGRVSDKMHGKTVWYSKKGIKTIEAVYNKNELVEIIYYDTHGVAMPEAWPDANAKACEAYDKKDLKEATKLFEKAKSIAAQQYGVNTREYAQATISLAFMYHEQKEYEKEEELFTEAKKIKEDIEETDDSNYSNVCMRLGELYFIKGQYAKAHILLLKSKDILERLFGKEDTDYLKVCDILQKIDKEDK